jgi:uncharacterized protein (TIGR00725 family)
MTKLRDKAIIAVFGSKDQESVAIAKEIGGIIARRGQILLTGGTRAGMDSVKHSAIAGVGSSPWIGVGRANSIDAFEPPGGGFIIQSDLGHKRNYLEACLCDAAIGLKGGDGTLSEVTFALSLQRPVALIGDHWKSQWILDDARNRPQTLKQMVERAFGRVGEKSNGKHSLDAVLTPSVILGGLEQLPPYTYFTSTNTPEDVVDWVTNALSASGNKGRAGAFPSIEGYERVAAKYDEYLARIGRARMP